jgi:hypothetical protein
MGLNRLDIEISHFWHHFFGGLWWAFVVGIQLPRTIWVSEESAAE